MKIIDLLNKIANNEEVPKKIKYENREYYLYDNESYLTTDKTRFFDRVYFSDLNIEVEILEEEKKTIDCLNLSLEEIEAFQEARQIFLKLNNEEDKQTFIKLLLGEGTYERWIDYLKSKGE